MLHDSCVNEEVLQVYILTLEKFDKFQLCVWLLRFQFCLAAQISIVCLAAQELQGEDPRD